MSVKKALTIIVTMLLVFANVSLINAPVPENHETKYGGTLVCGTNEGAANLGVATANFAIHNAAVQSYNSLCMLDMDLNLKPDLAESWEISPDGKVWTFHLVQNATWHDGVPFASDDVKYSVEEILLKYHGSAKNVFKNLDRIETPDAYTVKIIFSQPHAAFSVCLNNYLFPIMPKHIYESTDYLTNPATTTKAIGTGPFIMQEFVEGSHVIWVKNPNYFKAGLPYLDKIILRFIPEASSLAMGVLSHEIDYMQEGELAAALESIKNDPDIVTFFAGGEDLLPAPVMAMFNCRGAEGTGLAPFDNVQVRRAAVYAINETAIREKAFGGALQDRHTPIPQEAYYDESIEDPDLNPSMVCDPERAEQILDEEGYPRDPVTGIRFQAKLVTDSREERVRFAELVKENLDKVGIQCLLAVLDFTTASQRIFVEHNFDIYTYALNAGPDPCIGMARALHSQNIGIIPYTNGGAYSNPRVDELFNLASTVINATKRRAYFVEIQQIATSEAACSYVGVLLSTYFWNKDVKGLPPSPLMGLELLENVYWEPQVELPPGGLEELIARVVELESDVADVISKLDTAIITTYAALIIGIIALITAVLSFIKRERAH
jgi:peptide/nickel transport system substrate-binding protein